MKKVVAKVKRNASDKRLAWLLERGITFDGKAYLTEGQFEKKYKNKQRIMPFLAINDFIADGDMVRIVPVQAPKNYTADLILRKGSSNDSSLPVLVKRTNLEEDYPFLTKELAEKLGSNLSFVAKCCVVMGLKGDPKYHQEVRSSKSGGIQRYSQAALQALTHKLKNDPSFNPYDAQ